DLPVTARHRCAPDDHGPDGLQLYTAAGGGLRRPDAGQQQGCRGADQEAVDDEEDHLVEIDTNPREVTGLGVAPDCECPASQLHVFKDEVDDEITRDADDEKQRDDVEESFCPQELELSIDQLE